MNSEKPYGPRIVQLLQLPLTPEPGDDPALMFAEGYFARVLALREDGSLLVGLVSTEEPEETDKRPGMWPRIDVQWYAVNHICCE